MTLRRIVGPCLVAAELLLCAGATAWLQVQVTLPGFAPVYEMLALDLKKAIPSLKRGFSVIPHPQYTYAIAVRNKDDETVIQLKGLPPQQYLVRFKARFPIVNHQITIFLNDQLLGTAVPQAVEIAQKFRFLAPLDAIRQDRNEIRFVHHGVRAAVAYELLELRNYQSASDSGNIRLYFDGPWINQVLHAVPPRTQWRLWGVWLAAYAALWLLAVGVGRFILRLKVKRIGWFMGISTALAPLVPLVAWMVTRISPMTVWVAPKLFVMASLIGPAAMAAILLVPGLIRTCLGTQTALVEAWTKLQREAGARLHALSQSPLRYERVLAALQIISLVVWFFIQQGWQVVVTAVRWLRRDVVRHGFTMFAFLYGIGVLCLAVEWRGGAEWLVNAAFGGLIVAVLAVGWRALRMAWALRGFEPR